MMQKRVIDPAAGPLGNGPLRLMRRPEGVTAQSLGNRLGRSERTIRRWSSFPRQEYLDNAQARREQAQKLYQQGLTATQIAEKTGIPRPSVYRYIQQLKAQDKAS